MPPHPSLGQVQGSALRPLSPSSIDPPGAELIGGSPAMARLRAMAAQVARKDVTVLINGETGTGKEVFARYVHAHSPRAGKPFVAINCAALPEGLVESELFGHERGAFTGAVGAHRGCFEEAHTGTLFLDEVTEVGPHVQAKLLRAVQEHEVRRVGGTGVRRVDVRIIAASSRDLKRAMAEGTLREDLYYRLRMVELDLPPLRARREDVEPLALHFLRRHAERNRSPLRGVSPAALALMRAYDWPGNVRELENAVGRATVFALPEDGELLLPGDLPPEVRGAAVGGEPPDPEAKLDLRTAILCLKRSYAGEALRLAGGNKVRAARLLGMSRRGLYHLLREVGTGDG